MRVLKALTLLLAILGVGALILASHATARPLTALSAINPAMNFAYVRVHGTVTAYPTLSVEDGYLTFHVQDITAGSGGDLRITAYRATVQALLAQGRIPMPGDVVTVEGTLRVRDDEPSLVLNTPEALDITAPAEQHIDLEALDAIALGERACTQGQVRRVRDASETLRIVTLRDDNAVADVLLPLNLAPVFGSAPALQVGEWISVTGGVGEYRGERQLLPGRVSDVAVTGAQPLDTRAISGLSKDMLGQWVSVRGEVNDLQPIEGGMLIDLVDVADGDAPGAITVVMFDAWSGVPFSQALQLGEVVVVQGELVDYHGQLELKPELSVDLMKNE